ncbi:sigma-54 interaction domain-containing protein [Acinetobacter venetianus]|uniref:sigma-54 interaction domain-containing protein n=1 Tax=Acinetobacter venetianus TaxID=52133 RepID=UPI00214F817E|nr:sigma-54 dependent transcriptional regulator [Acinetobacter venetianus]MCR4531975.1 sigma-54 dependent transcriptional regulator [Acinetobacter venetianus]MDA0698163.1 sigma-54 dependent transcriptional regulator [Pseudomonadota bacterium]MDA1256174.1 sigma-54 dependent transcriptional regulator [Pseudomonadota bacterium]
MTQPIDFKTQVDLENFLGYLQQLITDCALFIVDHTDSTIIYEFKSTRLNPSISALSKQQILNNALDTGKFNFKSTNRSSELFCHRHNIHVSDQNFTGTLFLVQLLQQIETTLPKLSIQSLSETFHSQSPEMQRMFSIIQRVAITEFPVLVRGESGSGKELVAQAIHGYSQRKNKVFIAINCAALNANILESELFGHVKGAFTGAIREHKGVFERAAGGTLFLDEIAEIPLELQAKLLRVLETGEFTPLGGEKSIKANVRIITATHRALREEAKLGRFRQDLLYRLRVIPIFVPPLRDRKEDIPLIANFILSEQQTIFQHTPSLSNDALNALIDYDWPGNVRELKNTLLYAITMANEKSEIELCDLPDEIIDNPHIPSDLKMHTTEHIHSSDKINKDMIRKALIKYDFDLNQVAKALDMSRTTLWRYRKKFNL